MSQGAACQIAYHRSCSAAKLANGAQVDAHADALQGFDAPRRHLKKLTSRKGYAVNDGVLDGGDAGLRTIRSRKTASMSSQPDRTYVGPTQISHDQQAHLITLGWVGV